MMKKILIAALIFFSITCSFSQNVDKNKPVSKEEKVNDEHGYKYIHFKIKGLYSEEKKANFEAEISNNPNFIYVEIKNNNLHGYVKKDYYDNITDFFKANGVEIVYKNKHKKLAPIGGSKNIVIPENMKPKYIDTGNPKQDEKRYTEAKKQLLIEHPEFIKQ